MQAGIHLTSCIWLINLALKRWLFCDKLCMTSHPFDDMWEGGEGNCSFRFLTHGSIKLHPTTLRFLHGNSRNLSALWIFQLVEFPRFSTVHHGTNERLSARWLWSEFYHDTPCCTTYLDSDAFTQFLMLNLELADSYTSEFLPYIFAIEVQWKAVEALQVRVFFGWALQEQNSENRRKAEETSWKGWGRKFSNASKLNKWNIL